MKEKILALGAEIEQVYDNVFDVSGTLEVLKKVIALLEKAGYANDSLLFGGVPEVIGGIRVCEFTSPGFLAFPASEDQMDKLGKKVLAKVTAMLLSA